MRDHGPNIAAQVGMGSTKARSSAGYKVSRQPETSAGGFVAERVGFEPTVRLPVRRISSAVLSTTQPPLRSRRMPPGRRLRSGAGSSSGPVHCLDRQA